MTNVAERATPGADVAKNHEGGGAAPEAFADIGAGGFFADGVQLSFAQHGLDFAEAAGAVAGLVQDDVRNRRTGISFNPTGQPNTNPMTAPSPNAGQAAGIETQRNDGVL